MKHIKLFEEYLQTLQEGQISIYNQGNPYSPEEGNKGLQWPYFYKEAQKWLDDKIAVTVITAEFDYDKKTTDPKYRSEINGTWDDKSLPKFTDEHSNYDESEFDLIKVDESLKMRDGVYIQDKNGLEFCMHPSRILEVQKGASVRDDIAAGATYLVDKMRARIFGYQNGVVTIKLQNGETKDFTLKEWKEKNYLPLDESKIEENI